MRCHAFQALFRAKDNALLIQVTLFSPPKANGAMFVGLAPLGAVLTGGSPRRCADFAFRFPPF